MEQINEFNLDLFLESLKEKYSYQKTNISEYFKYVNDYFYEYAKTTGDFRYETVLNDIISGENCQDYADSIDPKALYYFKEVNGCTTFTELDYDLLTELVDEALEVTLQKDDKDFGTC